MRNILFYTDTPNYGGAEKQMVLLAKHLQLLGCNISLAYGGYSLIKKYVNDLKVYNETFPLQTIHKHDLRHYTELKKLLKKNQFDLVHIHLWNPGSCRYAFWAAKHAKIPIIVTEHDPFELSGIKRIIKRSCIAKTDQIIAISMDNYKQLVQSDENIKNRLNLIHNGIEVDRFLDKVDKASLPIQKGDLVITCIAELHERKGQKYLIDAFKMLQAEIPSLHLVLVGTGPNESVLKQRYEGVTNLHFLGWRNDIPQILKASDIFVLSSLREAFGLVILEAMASRVAVIATNNGGAVDIIEDGKTGYLVPPANADKLANAIRTLLRNPNQKRDMEEAAFARVRDEFSAEKMAHETLKVYAR